MKKNKILITGVCGFIGFHLARSFISKGYYLVGIDNMRKTYDPRYKSKRLNILKKFKNFKFTKIDLKNFDKVKEKNIKLIIHLAGEAGVRESVKKPNFYIDENIQNTIKVFEFAKKNGVKNVFYASSSSVYGNCNAYPSRESLVINKPLSVYGLSKATCELLAYYYKSVFNINSIGLRFFTVYGPFGRPDMSMNIFIKNIIKKRRVNLFNHGKNFRDYTYVDDVTSYIIACFEKVRGMKNYYKIFNIGGENTIRIDKLLSIIENILKKKAKVNLVKKNKLDPPKSLASNKNIKLFTKKNFKTKLIDGVKICINSMKAEGI